MNFSFIAKHRGWLCGAAVGVTRGGFYAWLTRPRSRRSQSDEERVWHDMPAEGVSCGLHRIERSGAGASKLRSSTFGATAEVYDPIKLCERALKELGVPGREPMSDASPRESQP